MWAFLTALVKALPWSAIVDGIRWLWPSRNRKVSGPTPWAQPGTHTEAVLRHTRKVLKASDAALYIFHNGSQPASMKALASSHHEDSPVPSWAWEEKLDPYNCGVLFAYQWHGNPYFDNLESTSFPDTQPTSLFGAEGVTHILAWPMRSKDRSKTLGSLVVMWTDNIPYDVDAFSLMEDEATKVEATIHRLR